MSCQGTPHFPLACLGSLLVRLSLVVSPKVWQRPTEGKPHGLLGVSMQSSSALDEILEGLNPASATHKDQGHGTLRCLSTQPVRILFVSYEMRSIKTHALL